MCELKALRDEVTQYEIDDKIEEFYSLFIVDEACESTKNCSRGSYFCCAR